MFGDIGHGFVLFLVGSILCIFDGPLRRNGLEGALKLRYLIFLMGLFATFNGLIYNDFIAIPWWIFKSCYNLVEDKSKHFVADHSHHHGPPMKAEPIPDCVYPLGIDPTWYLGSNELTFMNSLKMKLSVILGIL